MSHNASTITSVSPARMNAPEAVKVGTRGTVGSLIRKEMEYYSELERNLVLSKYNMVDKSCGPGVGKSCFIWNRGMKKRRGRFLPSLCCVSKVADPRQQLNGLASFSYMNLKAQAKE